MLITMTVNPEYVFTTTFAKAIKGTAPFVGVPVPGHAPLVLDRKRLCGALRGVTPVNIEVVWTGNARSLLVEGVDGNVRTRMRMVCRSWKEWAVQREMDRWEASQRRKSVKTISLPAGADRKAAAEYRKQAALLSKLNRELDKLGYEHTLLYNPAVPRESGHSYSEYYAGSWRLNYGGKRLRTIIGGIAAQARRDGWTNIRLYKELTGHGISFTKLSDMTMTVRERRGAVSFHSYLKNLYCFCQGTGYSSPGSNSLRGEWNRGDRQTWGGERYMVKLADMQTRRSLQTQIDSIKAMMEQAAI
jgi:hypothetical protein